MENKKPEIPQRDNNFQWKSITKTMLFWILIFIGTLWIVHVFNDKRVKEIEIEDYTTYRSYLERGIVKEAEIIEREFRATKLTEDQTISQDGQEITFSRFHTTLPHEADRKMVAEWDSLGVKCHFKQKTTEWWGYLVSFFPWILIILLYLFFLRRLQ